MVIPPFAHFDPKIPQCGLKKGFFQKISMVSIEIFDFKWKLFGHWIKNQGISRFANPLISFGVPNRTPLEMPKTYPTDIIRQIEKTPPPICGYINVWGLLLHLTDNVKYVVNPLLVLFISQNPKKVYIITRISQLMTLILRAF